MSKENKISVFNYKKLDKIFGEEIRKIVNNNFYNNETGYNKEKNTTATETKKNKISDENIRAMINNMDNTDAEEFIKFIEKHWGTKVKRFEDE